GRVVEDIAATDCGRAAIDIDADRWIVDCDIADRGAGGAAGALIDGDSRRAMREAVAAEAGGDVGEAEGRNIGRHQGAGAAGIYVHIVAAEGRSSTRSTLGRKTDIDAADRVVGDRDVDVRHEHKDTRAADAGAERYIVVMNR